MNQTNYMTAPEFLDHLRRHNNLRDFGKYYVHGEVKLVDRHIGTLLLGQGHFERLDLGNSIVRIIALESAIIDHLDYSLAKTTIFQGGNALVQRLHLSAGQIDDFLGERSRIQHVHCGDRTSKITRFTRGENPFGHIHVEDNMYLAYYLTQHQ